jgi:hypothetical protein
MNVYVYLLYVVSLLHVSTRLVSILRRCTPFLMGRLSGIDECIQNLYTGSVGKPIRTSSRSTPRPRWEDNIKVYIKVQYRRAGKMVVSCGQSAHFIECSGSVK